jgi:hypothetical protein
MTHGALWNALNPTLIERSDSTVLSQKLRRSALTADVANISTLSKGNHLPKEWTDVRKAVVSFDALEDFNETIKRFRLMISSAMSIFVFTFQGSMEAALSTFVCRGGMLLKTPIVRCNIRDPLYGRLVVISIFGIFIYCIVLPCSVVLVLRSRWCRNVFIHDNMAYCQLVGFLTSLYDKRYKMWELIICTNKLVLISIPMFLSQNAVVQSLSTFVFMLIYMFFVLYLKPMQSNYLNKIEILSCIGVVVGAFSAVFFVVELGGSPLLSGSAKDTVGLVFILICVISLLMSIKYIYQDFVRLFLMYSIAFTKSWILGISAHLGAAGTQGVYIPIVAMLFNKFSSREVVNLKQKLRYELSEYMDRERSVFCIAQPWRSFCSWFHRTRVLFRARQYKPPPDLLEKCMKEPELEALIYLQKLSERVVRWERVSWKYWGVSKKDLPSEFREVKGFTDPPHSEYVYQSNVIHMLEDALPPSVHRVLTSLMFSHLMMMARTDLTPSERE